MAKEMWGSTKVLPIPNIEKLHLVTQFFGWKLEELDTTVTKYLQDHSTETRADAISALTSKEEDAKRMEVGLDILNQLGAVG